MLIKKYDSDHISQSQIYTEMSNLVSSEGKDPTLYLEQAKNARYGLSVKNNSEKSKKMNKLFLGPDELTYIRRLRRENKIEKAEDLLKKALPTPAVLDEMRKNASVKAKHAKKSGDWKAVVEYLEGYNSYAEINREYCIKLVNQAPPTHTKTDILLLQKAIENISQ